MTRDQPSANRNGTNSLQRTLLGAVHRLTAGGAVLVYHGILESAEVPSAGSMHVNPERFAATVRALTRVSTLVPLSELLSRQRRGQSTKGLVAITFDDAYHSVRGPTQTLIASAPVPITLFVVLDGARTGAPFWWDRIEKVIAVATRDRWRLFEDYCGLPEAFRRGQSPTQGPLWPFRQWILAEHLGRWPAALEEPLAELEQELGCRATQRPLTFDELDTLARNPLVDVAAHSVSHPVLPLLSDDEIRHEIGSSYRALRARYPNTLSVLAPPFGLYDDRTIKIGQEEGLSACLTIDATLLDDSAPSYTIPRIGMTAAHRPWQAMLFALGCWRGMRPKRRDTPEYPVLPSATT